MAGAQQEEELRRVQASLCVHQGVRARHAEEASATLNRPTRLPLGLRRGSVLSARAYGRHNMAGRTSLRHGVGMEDVL